MAIEESRNDYYESRIAELQKHLDSNFKCIFVLSMILILVSFIWMLAYNKLDKRYKKAINNNIFNNYVISQDIDSITIKYRR